MAKKPLADDAIFVGAKNKIHAAIQATGEKDVAQLISLVNCLTKMKAVELKMQEDDWGSGLGGDPPAAEAT